MDKSEAWQDSTRYVHRVDAYAQIADLKRQPGKDILLTGNRTLWSDLLAHGLVDKLHLMIGNIVTGGEPQSLLRLIDIIRRGGSDNFVVKYAVGLQQA